MSLFLPDTADQLAPPASGWDDYWYGDIVSPVSAGVKVDEYTALTYSAVWACTRVLSASAAAISLPVYRKIKRGKEPVEDHPVHRLLNLRPNKDMLPFEFRASRVQFQLNWGNGYAEIERDQTGNPFALWPIHSSRVKPFYKDDGTLWYEVKVSRTKMADGKFRLNVVNIPAYNMLHFPSIHSDNGIVGLGIIEHARESIGFGIASEKYGASFFGSGGTPIIVVETEGRPSAAARRNFRKEWKEIHSSPDNAGTPALLAEGMKAKALSFSASDQQFLESRRHSNEEIARWYGVPPHLIQDLLNATYGSDIEQQSLEFVTFSLIPWLRIIEQEIWAKLFNVVEQQSLFVEHKISDLQKANIAARVAKYQNGLTLGWLSPNDVREENDLNPYEGGDIYLVQGAMIPIDQAGALQEAQIEAAKKAAEAPAQSPSGRTPASNNGKKPGQNGKAKPKNRLGFPITVNGELVTHSVPIEDYRPVTVLSKDSVLELLDSQAKIENLENELTAFRSATEHRTESLVRNERADLAERLLAATECKPEELGKKVFDLIKELQDG